MKSSRLVYAPPLLVIALVSLAIATVANWLMGDLLRTIHQDQAVITLKAAAGIAEFHGHDYSVTQLQKMADIAARTTGGRATVIDTSGLVVADTDVPQEELGRLENHATRPEVIDAWEKGLGVSRRHSASIDKDLLYMAVPVSVGQEKVVFRLALYSNSLERAIDRERNIFFILAFIGSAVVGALGLWLTRSLVSQLRKKQDELVEARDEARLANEAKSIFLANMSHELRTPLNAIIGFSDMALAQVYGPIESRYAAYAKDVNDSGKHLLTLVNDILDMSKIETGMLTLEEETFNPETVIDGAMAMVSERASDAGITMKKNVDHPLPALRADPRRTKQMLLNLLSNGIKFTAKGGNITISTASNDDGSFSLSVSDSGSGMDERAIAHALEPFSHASRSFIRQHDGAGLGLPIVRNIINSHGGSLAINSAQPGGTTVSITFPPERVVPAGAA